MNSPRPSTEDTVTDQLPEPGTVVEITAGVNAGQFGLVADPAKAECTIGDPRPRVRVELLDGEIYTPLLCNIKAKHIEQPMPKPNGHVSIQSLVRADLVAREQVGIQRYGTALQPHNGRDALRDAYEEALDLACYLKQAMVEREAKARWRLHIAESRAKEAANAAAREAQS